MKIELLTEAHLPDVARIEALCFKNPWSEASLSFLLRSGNFGVAATENGHAIAYVGVISAIDEGEITNVATHPNHRRHGAAEAILTFLESECPKRGISRLTLEVRESNLPARTLYEKLGYTPCGIRKGFYTSPREDGVLMEKRFSM